MITIDEYTGNWRQALRPTAPEEGDTVEVAEECDAREWDDFKRILRDNGLDLSWEDWDEDARVNTYRVVPIGEEEE